MTPIEELIEHIEPGVTSAAYPSEEAYKAAWQRAAAGNDPFESAFLGGMLADRLSWVFLAAYQSAVRACFDGLSAASFVSYAASEDRSGEYPGTTIDADGRLQGNKSWIASSRTVDELLVTVGSMDNIVRVPVGRAGVAISHRDSPSFLGDLSQGMAAFADVALADTDYVRHHRVYDFRIAEPFFVTLAACGYLVTLEAQRRVQIVEIAAGLQELFKQGFAHDIGRLLELYQILKVIGREHADKSPTEDWVRNGKLLGMYRPNLEAALS